MSEFRGALMEQFGGEKERYERLGLGLGTSMQA